MSQQLTVDVEALADMGKQLNHIKYDLDRVERIDHDAHEFVVDTKIAQALHEFSTNWSDKRQQLSHMIGFAGASALKAAETYDGNDKAASKQQQEQGRQVKQQLEKTGLGAATPVVHTTSGSGDHSARGAATDSTGSTTADIPTDSGSTDTGYAGSSDPGTATVPTDTGSGGSVDSGGGDTGSADTSDQNLSADGTLSDSGTVGLSAQASAGGPAEHHGGHGSAVTHNAAMAAPVGLLGAAGAAAWASQRRKEKEDESAAEETEV